MRKGVFRFRVSEPTHKLDCRGRRGRGADETTSSFNPKPEAMVGSGMDRPRVAPTIASGFGLNELGDV